MHSSSLSKPLAAERQFGPVGMSLLGASVLCMCDFLAILKSHLIPVVLFGITVVIPTYPIMIC